MSNKNPKIAVTITLKAQPGKAHALSELLESAAQIVKETEPGTLFWYSTQIEEDTFTINDGFNDEASMKAHFDGKVAAALKEKSSELVVGGWDKGVLPNIQQSKVLSSIK
jgi:quinol monooxygenase YgiN